VKTPAVGTDLRLVVATKAKSGTPDDLIPHATPEAANPGTLVMLMV
jgi:hypothetical protein